MGIRTVGIRDIAVKIPVIRVDEVWSNTTSDSAKLIAVEPIALISVPSVIIIKSCDHRVFFIGIISCV